MTEMRFKEWLADQQNREDFVGEFARVLDMQDIVHQESRRRVDEHRSWADIVIRMAQPGYIDAFNQAWQEFLAVKQASGVSTDKSVADKSLDKLNTLQ
jgi:hypothetical protein